jgi:hypothetical protein
VPVKALAKWALENRERMNAAQRKFDAQSADEKRSRTYPARV